MVVLDSWSVLSYHWLADCLNTIFFPGAIWHMHHASFDPLWTPTDWLFSDVIIWPGRMWQSYRGCSMELQLLDCVLVLFSPQVQYESLSSWSALSRQVGNEDSLRLVHLGATFDNALVWLSPQVRYDSLTKFFCLAGTFNCALFFSLPRCDMTASLVGLPNISRYDLTVCWRLSPPWSYIWLCSGVIISPGTVRQPHGGGASAGLLLQPAWRDGGWRQSRHPG